MRSMKYGLFTAAAAAIFLLFPAKPSQAQISVGVNIGAAPDCPYGYYDYSPYPCAPYGYYGPEWFNGGAFVGAGPWFHGPAGFHGNVNNHMDPQHGYKGKMPQQHEHAAAGRGPAPSNFKGNEVRDGKGHSMGGGGKR